MEQENWMNNDDFSDVNNGRVAPHTPGDVLYKPIPIGCQKDERRTCIMY